MASTGSQRVGHDWAAELTELSGCPWFDPHSIWSHISWAVSMTEGKHKYWTWKESSNSIMFSALCSHRSLCPPPTTPAFRTEHRPYLPPQDPSRTSRQALLSVALVPCPVSPLSCVEPSSAVYEPVSLGFELLIRGNTADPFFSSPVSIYCLLQICLLNSKLHQV